MRGESDRSGSEQSPRSDSARARNGERYDVSSLDLCISGGAALPVHVLRGFDEASDCKVLEGYGLSETNGMATFNPPDRERKPGSIGVPTGDTEIRLVDEQDNEVPQGEPGELVIRGSFVMKGYWDRDDATSPRGCRRTAASAGLRS